MADSTPVARSEHYKAPMNTGLSEIPVIAAEYLPLPEYPSKNVSIESDYRKGTSLLNRLFSLLDTTTPVTISTLTDTAHVNMNASLLPQAFAVDDNHLDVIRSRIEEEYNAEVLKLSAAPMTMKRTYSILGSTFRFEFDVHGIYSERGELCPIVMIREEHREAALTSPCRRVIGQIPRLIMGFALAAMDAQHGIMCFVDDKAGVTLVRASYVHTCLPFRRRLVALTHMIFIQGRMGKETGDARESAMERHSFLPFDIFVETLVVLTTSRSSKPGTPLAND
ncbi:hypothetical protein J8273_6231 [Carpediemonas membranifera]|uniref:Uncharacterized protein n=1 Tax=Carpediemonas membranifera TaxID=201153 RepID=A0A8J6AQI9_9EUKA|nr:hypothetical protein J8273_6231 [Carpediemonas membranifera]|eukprot:KAG9391471.1 hypothetical protein J8273_6231 [Carpediemonas membranifera]